MTHSKTEEQITKALCDLIVSCDLDTLCALYEYAFAEVESCYNDGEVIYIEQTKAVKISDNVEVYFA